MKDRVPTKVVNGAIRMEQLDENGNSLGYVYLKRADEPSEEGTPYNKNSILQDKTASALGVTVQNPTANDAFAKIATNISTAKGDISTIKGNISTANNNINTINGKINTINTDISTIKSDVNTIKGNIANKQNKTKYIIEEYEDEDATTEFEWELTTSSWKELYFEIEIEVDDGIFGVLSTELVYENGDSYLISEGWYVAGYESIQKIYISGGTTAPLIMATQARGIAEDDGYLLSVDSFNIIPNPNPNLKIKGIYMQCSHDMNFIPLKKIEVYDVEEEVS